jgi:hypothetical protein
VDAASKIVLRRDSPDTAASRGDMPVAPEQLRALASSLAKPRVAPPEAGVGDDASCAAEGPKPPTMMDMVESYLKPRPDELNLAGLLNVLDGVVDTPGRLLILTSSDTAPPDRPSSPLASRRVHRTRWYLSPLAPPTRGTSPPLGTIHLGNAHPCA